jgi:NAD(P)H dehydrogenase (quinone)
MRVLVLYAHPVGESYGAALHAQVVASLKAQGHEVDDCDLYSEGFDPVLSGAERRGYHAIPENRIPVETYVRRVEAAEALVLCFPVWNFGFPAMLKGFFDRVFLPGVSFRLVDGLVRPNLWNIRKLAAITTYGGPRHRVWLMGDPPRKSVCRVLRTVCHPKASPLYLAHYDMNRSTPKSRAEFLAKVSQKLARWR